jgi:hypothetical protein
MLAAAVWLFKFKFKFKFSVELEAGAFTRLCVSASCLPTL